MKLQTFVDILRGGNLALGSKLSNLLTEDCTILEYTTDSVLFSKGHKLVLATFKNPLVESKMTSANILDNEVVEISKAGMTESMQGMLHKVVECVVSENLVDAQEHLDEFCQTFYQMAILKNRYPEVFVEELVKSSKGRSIRMEARQLIPAFKAEIFNSTVLTENYDEDSATTSILALVESNLGKVLVLGKEKVKAIVTDALLGNAFLAESITNSLYDATEFVTKSTLLENDGNPYDMGAGKFSDEDEEELEAEENEIPAIPTEKENINDEDESKEFEPFNPAMFSEDDIKQLHKTTLKSILLAMQDFIHDKAADSADDQIDPDLADQINADLLAIDDEDLGDDRLSEIEARWNPMISYFLDSSYHTPSDELEDLNDQPIEDQLPPEAPEDVTPVGDATQGTAAPAPAPAPAAPAPAPMPAV